MEAGAIAIPPSHTDAMLIPLPLIHIFGPPHGQWVQPLAGEGDALQPVRRPAGPRENHPKHHPKRSPAKPFGAIG